MIARSELKTGVHFPRIAPESLSLRHRNEGTDLLFPLPNSQVQIIPGVKGVELLQLMQDRVSEQDGEASGGAIQ